MTTGRINQVSASPPTPAKSGTHIRPQSCAPAFTEAVVCTKWVVSKAPTQHRHEAAHLSAAYTFSRTDKAQRNLKQNALCPDRCQGPAQRLQTSQKKSYPESTSTQAPAACADLALACNTARPNQLHTRFGGSQRDGLWQIKNFDKGAPQGKTHSIYIRYGIRCDPRKTMVCCKNLA